MENVEPKNSKDADNIIHEYIVELQGRNKELEQKCKRQQVLLEEKEIQIQELTKKIKEISNKVNRKESTGRNRNNNINDTVVVNLKEQKKSIREIASQTGLSPTTVQKILRRNKNKNVTS